VFLGVWGGGGGGVIRRGVTLVDNMACGQIINSDLYIQTLQTLQKSLTRVRPHKKFGEILLEHKARLHTSLKPHEAITKLGRSVLPHQPYSPKPFPVDGI
jgi:hypothetical protein